MIASPLLYKILLNNALVLLNNAFVLINDVVDLTNIDVVLTIQGTLLHFTRLFTTFYKASLIRLQGTFYT